MPAVTGHIESGDLATVVEDGVRKVSRHSIERLFHRLHPPKEY
jgi:hypothetical protein